MDKEIAGFIKKYYQKNFAGKKFVPGETHIPASGKSFDYQEMVLMTEAVLDGWWTEGRFAAAFEKQLAEFVGVKHCVTTNSGSSANLLAISALTSYHLGERRLKPGDEVITLAAGFPTTINPIILHQAIPVFVDIDLATANVDIGKLEKAFSKKTKAVFLPHHLGNPFNVAAVQKLCKKHKAWLIEDCCDALGAKFGGKRVGSFGDLSTFSFYAAHHITSGEGGAIMTNDERLAAIVRSFRDWGREYWFKTGEDIRRNKGLGTVKHSKLPADYDDKFIFSEIGYNLRLTDMQAALGLVQLGKIGEFAKRRESNFQYLYKLMSPYKKFFILPGMEKSAAPSWFGFLMTLKPDCPFTRKEFVDYLHKHNVGTRMFLAGNVIKQPYFQIYKVKFKAGNLASTDYVLSNSVWVGVHQAIDNERREYMGKVLKSFLAKYK
ncbi:MAG: lipopolysaccharide biosynthesis protein RfbH [bacterium]|nr:lipopolysaccharide biosynthesis protein RfbH [bacterium]